MANEILSVEGQLVGIPLQEYTAGPGIVVDNVDKVIKVADDFIVSQVDVYTVPGGTSYKSINKSISKTGYKLLSINIRSTTGWTSPPYVYIGAYTETVGNIDFTLWYLNNRSGDMTIHVDTLWMKVGG